MAIEYDLVLGTPSPIPQVANALHDVARQLDLFDVPVTPDELVDPGTTTGHGTWIRVLDGTPKFPWSAVADDLGFAPTVRVAFTLDKFREIRDQQDDMIRLVTAMLDRIPGDVVLHMGYEQIWLLRRDGELTISEATDIWPPHRLALIPQPYRRATHAFS